jgi:hypothetical protein
MFPSKRSLMTLLVAGAFVLNVGAQSRQRDARQARARDAKQDERRPVEKTAGSTNAVERSQVDYLSGEANVAVSGNQNPVVKLGLSPNGATIIEFPAADKLFNIIPGNSNLVTVEESPTKETDRFVIVRPGDGFGSPATMAQARRAPATSVIVQMTSGLVITFLFYPVLQLSEQAHRVVVTYDRNQVIAARRASGLAVNLDSGVEEKQRGTTSLRVAQPKGGAAPAASGEPQSPEDPALTSQNSGEADSKSQPPGEPLLKRVDLANAASAALANALNDPDSFKKYGEDSHGLSISTLPVRELDSRSQVAVFKVRNSKKSGARLVPGQPEIFIETVNDKGKSVNVEPVRKLVQHTTALGDVIPGRGVEYYAVGYEAPILGAKQRLRVAVGLSTAADEPAIAALNNSEARKGDSKK